jgi:hypothetical protein
MIHSQILSDEISEIFLVNSLGKHFLKKSSSDSPFGTTKAHSQLFFCPLDFQNESKQVSCQFTV